MIHTSDGLESELARHRAAFARYAEPPTDLHRRIMAATLAAPRHAIPARVVVLVAPAVLLGLLAVSMIGHLRSPLTMGRTASTPKISDAGSPPAPGIQALVSTPGATAGGGQAGPRAVPSLPPILPTQAPPPPAQPSHWRRLAPSNVPAVRASAAMAYDEATGQTLLFGGEVYNGELGDTWTWDGSNWTLRSTGGPAARTLAAIAYDSATRQVVMFGGGHDGSGLLGDTWIWNGTGWSQWTGTSPSARLGATMVYDSDHQRLVMFGGFTGGGGVSADTWTWDGKGWNQVLGVEPPARYLASMAYDGTRHLTVLFGGGTAVGAQYLGDTWTFDGTTWQPQAGSPAPQARVDASLVYIPKLAAVVLLGGSAGQGAPRDIWELTGGGWSQLSADGAPLPRWSTEVAYESGRGRLLLFGGVVPASPAQPYGSNDTWIWTP
jgi:hypothetical protein